MKHIISIGLALVLACMPAVASPKGSIKIAGSTTVLPLSQLWAEKYMNKHSGVTISVSGGGTGQGLSSLINGTCNIANASRAAKSKEIQSARERNSQLIAHKVARDGLAIIVNPENNVKNLTMKQLAEIYTGKIKNWDEVGGKSSKSIVLVGRDTSSGTYGFFQDEVLGGKAYAKDMMSIPTTQQICQIVAQSPEAIGYVGMAYADEFQSKGKVHVISLSIKAGKPGMKPTEATVMSGEYPLFRYLYMYTLGTPCGISADFLKFSLSSEGQSLVKTAGYLPLN